MRSTLLSLVLSLTVVAALALGPSEARAQRLAQPAVVGVTTTGYYYTPGYSYVTPVIYSNTYVPVYVPAVTTSIAVPGYATYTGYYAAPVYTYGGWYGGHRRGGYYYR